MKTNLKIYSTSNNQYDIFVYIDEIRIEMLLNKSMLNVIETAKKLSLDCIEYHSKIFSLIEFGEFHAKRTRIASLLT